MAWLGCVRGQYDYYSMEPYENLPDKYSTYFIRVMNNNHFIGFAEFIESFHKLCALDFHEICFMHFYIFFVPSLLFFFPKCALYYFLSQSFSVPSLKLLGLTGCWYYLMHFIMRVKCKLVVCIGIMLAFVQDIFFAVVPYCKISIYDIKKKKNKK